MSGTSELHGRLRAAIRGAWSTQPTCWDRQTDAVLTVLKAEFEGCTCGEPACESTLCDCDAIPCPVNHRAEEAEAERDALKAIVRDLVDPDPCEHFDHHGHCQTHGWLDEGTCPHSRALDALSTPGSPEKAQMKAERDGALAQVAAIRTLITEDYGTDYDDEDVPAAVERLMRRLSAAEIARGEHGRSVLDRVSDWAADSIARIDRGETS